MIKYEFKQCLGIKNDKNCQFYVTMLNHWQGCRMSIPYFNRTQSNPDPMSDSAGSMLYLL